MILTAGIAAFFFIFMIYIRLPSKVKVMLRANKLYIEIILGIATALIAGSVTGLLAGLIGNMLFSLYIMLEDMFIKTADKVSNVNMKLTKEQRFRHRRAKMLLAIEAQDTKVKLAYSAYVSVKRDHSTLTKMCERHWQEESVRLADMTRKFSSE